MNQQSDMSPPFSVYDITDMASRDAVALCQVPLQDSPASVFFADGKYNVVREFALPVLTAAIVERICDKMVPCMLTERTEPKVCHAIIGADTVPMVSSEARIRWLKECRSNHTVDRLRAVLPIFAEDTAGITVVVEPIAQKPSMQPAPINSHSRQASYAAERAGFVESFIAWNWFPDLFGGVVVTHS